MRQYPKIIRTLCCTHRKGNFCPCGDARSITRYDAGLPHARQNSAKIDEINAKNRDTKQTKPIVDLAESGIHKRLANECWDMNTQKTMEWYDPMSLKNIFHVCIMNIRHCMFFFSPPFSASVRGSDCFTGQSPGARHGTKGTKGKNLGQIKAKVHGKKQEN